MTIQDLEQHILLKAQNALRSVYSVEEEINLSLTISPDTAMGHLTIACFPLAKPLRQNPIQIAEQIASHIISDNIIEQAIAKGPYINFVLKIQSLFGSVYQEITSQKDSFGIQPSSSERVMVEYLSPNTNKPLHLGHLRNGALGMAISNLLVAYGDKVVKANLINDRGIHICKSMLAWQKWANSETPESTNTKGDTFVGDLYVRFSKESDADSSLLTKAQEMLQVWEKKDPEIRSLWLKMNQWVLQGFDETTQKFGLLFDEVYFESQTYQLGKDIILEGLRQNIFTKDEVGNVICFLPVEEFGTEKDGTQRFVTLLRPDGTSLYITQDIGTAVQKATDHHLTSSVYVVGSEQEYHFKCLFYILQMLGYSWAHKCYHRSYGMVYLPDGKMKSREGKVVDADALMEEMISMAREEVQKRDVANALSINEIQYRAEVIALGAIKFYLLRVRPTQSIYFDPQESISFDGFTGPYCQYAYARIYGILEKAKSLCDFHNVVFDVDMTSEEIALLMKLYEYPQEVIAAAEEYMPSRIANHVFAVAKAFNQFYNRHSVLKSENEKQVQTRLALIAITAQVIKNGLGLLGIGVLENM